LQSFANDATEEKLNSLNSLPEIKDFQEILKNLSEKKSQNLLKFTLNFFHKH